MKYIPIQLIVAFVAFLALSNCHAQSLAFEGALGFGKYTRGGNQGKVLVVSSDVCSSDLLCLIMPKAHQREHCDGLLRKTIPD